MFMIFDEQQGKNEGMFHTINGYIFGNLPGLVMKQGDRVRWYLLGMGNEKDMHTAHWHGKTVTYRQRHTDVVELLPASMSSADMIADNPGTWMLHCHVADHMEAGMMATFTIVAPPARPCPIKLGQAKLWEPSEASSIEVTSNAAAPIRRLSLHAGYFLNGVQDLNAVLFEWLWKDEVLPNETKTLDLAAPQFQSSGLAGYFANMNVIGMIVYPGRIEYTDGSVWNPLQPGECFQAYWRDPDHHPALEALPPFQLDEEEQEDVD
jgi:hypothetical protein